MMRTGRVICTFGLAAALPATRGAVVSPAAAAATVAPSPQLVRSLKEHTKAVTAVAFSPDGKLLATASKDHGLKLWIVATGHSTDLAGVQEVNSAAFSPDGATLAVGTGVGIVLVDARTGEYRAVSKGQAKPVNAVAFSPDGKLLASACDDGTASVWGVPALKLEWAFPEHGDAVRSVAFSPDGKSVASGGGKGVFLWPPDAGAPLWTHAKALDFVDWVGPVAFSPDGALVARGGAHLELLNARTGELSLALANGTDVLSMAFSPDGKRFAAAELGNDVLVYDTVTGKLQGVLHGHRACVRSVAFSPDGMMLASGDEEGTVNLWDLAGPQPLDVPTPRAPAAEVLLERAQTLGGANSQKTPDGTYFDRFNQPVSKGDLVAVTVSAPAFRPQLLVRCAPEGAGSDATDSVASAGVGQECRLDLLVPDPGTLAIIILSPDAGAAGDYHLRVERLSNGAATRDPQGESVSGSVASADDYPLIPQEMHAGQRLVLVAESSDFVPTVLVSGPAGPDPAKQFAWNCSPVSRVSRSRLEVRIPADGRYLVGVTSREIRKPGSKFRMLIRREAAR